MEPLGWILLIFITVASVVAAILLAWMVVQLKQTLERVDGMIDYFDRTKPKIDRILDNVDGELVSLRSVTERVDNMAGDAEEMSGQVRDVVVPLVAQVGALTASLRYASAALVGVKAGATVLKQRWRE